jgi:hypothetical protein
MANSRSGSKSSKRIIANALTDTGLVPINHFGRVARFPLSVSDLAIGHQPREIAISRLPASQRRAQSALAVVVNEL